MHNLTYGINSLLHSVNLILFALLLINLILRISPHHSHLLCSHHLSLPQSFTPDLKLISFTNPFLHSQFYTFWTANKDTVQTFKHTQYQSDSRRTIFCINCDDKQAIMWVSRSLTGLRRWQQIM